MRPFPRPALRRLASSVTARTPTAPGHAVPRCSHQLRLRSVGDNRLHLSALKSSVPAAVPRDFATVRSQDLCEQLRFPLADARQPIAGGLRSMASAPGWGNLHTPPRGCRTSQHITNLSHTSRLMHVSRIRSRICTIHHFLPTTSSARARTTGQGTRITTTALVPMLTCGIDLCAGLLCLLMGGFSPS